MKKESSKIESEEMLPHYDFSGGVRGKYAARYQKGTNLILLDPDVAEVFSDAEAVNKTLRAAAEILKANPSHSKKLAG